MLQLKARKQKIGFCGPVALQMVLEYYGIKKTAKELAEVSCCTKEHGTTAEGLLHAAKVVGLKGAIKDFATISDLKKYVRTEEIPVIVDWWCWGEGHYSVVADIAEKTIFLQDPLIGRIRKVPIKEFERLWFDFAEEFLRSREDLIIRRMIVISR